MVVCIDGHVVNGGNKNSIKLWSGNLKGRCCFGDLGTDMRMKLKLILKCIGYEFMILHCRVQWWCM